jgi:hypothetical protein
MTKESDMGCIMFGLLIFGGSQMLLCKSYQAAHFYLVKIVRSIGAKFLLAECVDK